MMDTQKYSKASSILLIVVILLLPAYLLIKTYGVHGEENASVEPQFTGKESCVECHLTEYNDWMGSHHERAMDYATETTVLGDFNNVEFEALGMTHKFFMQDGKFMVNTDGADGTMQDFEIKFVFGVTPLQQYLVEFEGGRLQTLALTWNCLKNEWYHMAAHVYEGQNIEHGNWLHWTNQAQNWNSMCADCHSTNLIKGYDHKTDTYNTTWSEINVSCEACHGPGSEHLAWADLPDYAREDIENYGLVVKTSGIDHVQYVNNCVRCHSRRSSLQDFDHSSESIYDHVIPNLPEHPTWHIDGQIQDEDYVYASFIQSKMYMKEVQCNDCHNVHSGKLLYGTDYNKLCAQCHVSDIYDSPTHHFHKEAGMPGKSVISDSNIEMEVGSGTLCINCHMHGQLYMGVDYRRDHSFRIPRPDMSIKYGTPNACNQCHTNESNEWSEKHITNWFGKSRRFHFAEAFSGAVNENVVAVDQLQDIAKNELYPPSIRGLALQHMGTFFQDSLRTIVDDYTSNLDPTIRLAAIRANQVVEPSDIQRLLPLLNDETKAVRTEAARLLSTVGLDQIPDNYKGIYEKVYKEYENILIYSSDFPIGKFNLANLYYNSGKNELAEEFYIKALKQDEELHFVKLNLAYLYNRIGKNDKASLLFDDYLKHEPNDGQALYSYGLLLSEMQKYDESLETLLKANRAQPDRPRVAHNIAMMYDFKGDKTKAESYLKKEMNLVNDYNGKAELLRFYLTNQMQSKALNHALEMQKEFPNIDELNQVIRQLQGQ
ncbi:multiheme c-type cytochrome [Carboxylicivirga sp. N1Y90]|uniref:multiheme c-type cytochrome n=1 Tax=Carboxylicivirga fragile TaxID=3417571 RepID=UPI003D34A087|nr:hypothetical protein [Marinilabiliaceae bacterium N1Y90]